jgi:hypothetical protein
MDAAFPVYDEEEHLYVATGEQHAGMIAAAALRAAADQVVAMRPHGGRAWTTEQATAYDALTKVADHHLAIASELDNVSSANETN